MLSDELYQLKEFFRGNPKVALCFTGGLNSTYLLYIGKQCGAKISDNMEVCPDYNNNLKVKVCSPLKEFGITKPKVRMLSKKAELMAWDKPAYSCLADQIHTGEPITKEVLRRIERIEHELSCIGFTNFRVGLEGKAAHLTIPASQMEIAVEKRKKIIECLKPDFDSVLLNLEGL